MQSQKLLVCLGRGLPDGPQGHNPDMIPFIIAAISLVAEDIVLFDFEGKDYAGWTVTGKAFGTRPAQGTLDGQMQVTGYLGHGLINTYFGKDEATGTITSGEFKITRAYISFRIGGGADFKRLRLELLIGGRVVRKATGINSFPGGSEALVPDGWAVNDLQGRTARIRIIDESTGGWGHLNVDHLVQTDTKPIMQLTDAKRSFKIKHKYVHIPIDETAPARRLTVEMKGMAPVANQVFLAPGEPQYWATLDVSNRKGETLRFEVDRISSDSSALEHCYQSDEVPGQTKLYEEANRGQLRFSPRRGWSNDPNGMVYYKGEYHLFFQHNPYRAEWGNMHWGHAVSRDMVHWTELPIALFPDEHGTMWSGSAVVDNENTSGLGAGIVLFSTADGDFTQVLTHSPDGRTFKKWKANPVVSHIDRANRDPKLFWYAPGKKWVMVLYLEIPNHPSMQFLSSIDLIHWTPTSRIEGFHECPDFFELPVSGQTDVTKWVLTAANSNYQIGTFDGDIFHPESPILTGHRGRGFYAAQTFSDLPNRRVQIGWFQRERDGMPFNQAMSLPMELRLVDDPEGIRMTWTPVNELQSLRVGSKRFGALDLEPGAANPLKDLHPELAEIEMLLKPSSDAVVQFNLRGLVLTYDQASRSLKLGGISVPVTLIDGKLDLHIFVDRNGLDIFSSGGRVFIPWPYSPDQKNFDFEAVVSSGSVQFESLNFHELQSSWIPLASPRLAATKATPGRQVLRAN